MKTILVVDDQKNIRNVYGRLLSRAGFDIVLASNAVEAKELLVQKDVDLVLLDINMAEVDGTVLFDLIRAFHKEVKVVVSSVYPLEEQKQRIEKADDYYDKSEGLDVLLSKVRFYLGDDRDRKKRVVVIDDEAKVRVLCTHILVKAGYDTIGFSDNTLALKFLKDLKNRVDLVVLDLAMPAIDGCHFFEIIKMVRPGTKVLVSSNFPVEMQQAYIFDADDYFDKCDGKDVLLEKVGSLV